MASRPITAVLVHGAWHPPSTWDSFVPLLTSSTGLKTNVVSLPSINGPSPSTWQPDDDAAAVREAIVSELEKGNDVLMISHSYGGFPSAQGVEGLLKKDREGKPSVIGMVYLAAFAVPEGVTLLQGVGGEPLDWWQLKDVRLLPLPLPPTWLSELTAERSRV